MNQIKEAIEMLESEGMWYSNQQPVIDGIIALLRTEQPPAGELTEHIREQVKYICEMLQGKHDKEDVDWKALLTQVLVLCARLDASEASRKELLEAFKQIKVLNADKDSDIKWLCEAAIAKTTKDKDKL